MTFNKKPPRVKPTLNDLIKSGQITTGKALGIEQFAKAKERENFLRSVDEEIRIRSQKKLKAGSPKVKIS